MNIIIKWLSWLLVIINDYVGDWGITILIITFVIKLLLMPLSIKQKMGLEKQHNMNCEIQKIKERYHQDKKRMEEELTKISSKYSKDMLGCIVTFIQMPILYAVYQSIINLPIEYSSTILLPWIQNITLPDKYYIIPIFSALCQLLPYLLSYITIFKQLKLQKINITILIMTFVINGLFISNAPTIVGLYWIVSSVFSFFEQLISNFIKIRKIVI